MGWNPAAAKPLTRRKKLILKHTLISLSLLLVASLVIVIVRNRPKPYSPGEKVEGITSELARSIPAGYQPVNFTNVVQQTGIDFKHFHGTRSTQLPEDMGSGAAWGDYDGDDFQDLYVCDIAASLTASSEEVAASPGGNRLYRNNQDGTFTDVTEKTGVGFKGVGMGAAWADCDDDDRLDLFVVYWESGVALYRNEGRGRFSDVTGQAGLGGVHGRTFSALFFDFDTDGRLDLLIAEQAPFAEAVRCLLQSQARSVHSARLFRNAADGRFADVTKNAGLDRAFGTVQALARDFDGDGLPDLLLVNGSLDAHRLEPSVILRNVEGREFRPWTYLPGFGSPVNFIGGAVADFNRDGLPDIYLGTNPLFPKGLASGGVFVNRMVRRAPTSRP